MTKSRKNGRVEFLRFIFALAILFFHIHKSFAGDDVIELGNTGLNFFARGYIGVEFFFLVSGYLLAASNCQWLAGNGRAPDAGSSHLLAPSYSWR